MHLKSLHSRGRRQKDRKFSHCWLHIVFKASLGYVKSCFRKERGVWLRQSDMTDIGENSRRGEMT